MNDEEIKSCVDRMILNCSAIVGCGLPQTDFFADILTKQVSVHLVEYGYEALTYEEVMFAMNINEKRNVRLPSGLDLDYIDFKGNHFNVSFLSKIIQNYTMLRNNLDRRLQNHIDGFE